MDDRVIIDESQIHIQEKSQWCYAAIAQMVVQHYQGRLIPQSDIVKRVMATASPSKPGEKKNDNLPQDPFKYLNEMNHIRTSVDGSAPDPHVIRTEIDKKRPIIVRVGNSGSGHYMLIVGYTVPRTASVRTRNSVDRVIYIDPLKPNYTIESGSDANSRVETEYEDSATGKTQRAKDHITGYHLTRRSAVDSPKSHDSDSDSAAAASPKKTHKKSNGKSKGKRGGRRRYRNTKKRYSRTIRR
jgi:hypothetical protein